MVKANVFIWLAEMYFIKTSILMVVAGPNGSGKSTITSGIQIIGYYINVMKYREKKRAILLKPRK